MVKFDIKDYVWKVLREGAFYRELGLECQEAILKNVSAGNKSCRVIIRKDHLRYRGVNEGDRIMLWWIKIDEKNKPRIKELGNQIHEHLIKIKNEIKTAEEQEDLDEQIEMIDEVLDETPEALRD